MMAMEWATAEVWVAGAWLEEETVFALAKMRDVRGLSYINAIVGIQMRNEWGYKMRKLVRKVFIC